MPIHPLAALLTAALGVVGLSMTPPAPEAWAQQGVAAQTSDGWNHPEALELVERGRQARRDLATDGELETYRALTEGHIYFFVDPEEGEPSLIRVDQVAVELQWQAPDIVRQRVVGERSETRLPVREFRYYLDRLTLVQYGFGDEIQVGSGMDVAGVPHPLADPPGGSADAPHYDYRIVDSLSITLPGEPDPIRLTELEVRPRDPAAPGALGTLLLERATGSIVRMELSFTPASYVDRRTDRIEVEVDYGLWEGTYWLPNTQRIEVRRELPEVDLGVGTVIRAILRVGDYELNVPLPAAFEHLPSVVFAPEDDRAGYPFDDGLLDGLERDGLAGLRTRADPRELRAQAAELLANQPASGLSPFRLHLPRISSALRYNRAEGLVAGMGGTLRPSARLRLRGHGGWATGPDLPTGSLRLDGVWRDQHGWELAAEVNQTRDLGLRPGSDPLVSSLAATFLGKDYMDPWRTSSALAGLSLGTDATRVDLHAGVRRDRSMALTTDRAPLDRGRTFREVRPVADGTFFTAHAGFQQTLHWPGGGRGRVLLTTDLLTGSEGSGGAPVVEVSGRWASPTGAREVDARAVARTWIGDPLPQAHRLLGGRGTIPGYPFRQWVGRDAAVGHLEGALDLGTPLLRLRGGVHAGWAGRAHPTVMDAWDAGPTRGVRPAVTLGVGVGWDLLRIQGARGLRDGEWQLLLSLDPRWWDRL